MGLFRRKKKEGGIIELGDGNVLVSPEKLDELSDQAVEWVIDNYDAPTPPVISDAIGIAVTDRHDGDLRGKLKSLLATTAQIGYTARRQEDSLSSIRSDVPFLADECRRCMADGLAPADALAAVALAFSDLAGNDEAASSFGDIDGFPGVRDLVCKKLVSKTASIGAGMGLSNPGELPDGIDASELVADFRIGYLIRACEQSLSDLPADETSDDGTLIAVDIWAIEEAVGDWAEQNPYATEEEIRSTTLELIENPRFHVHPGEFPDDDSNEPRYSFFKFDRSGRMIPNDE